MNNNTIQNGDAMSGNEPTGARRRRKTKVAAWLGVAAVCAGGASLIPVGGATTQAVTGPTSEGLLCSNGTAAAGHRAFSLVASDGYISEPDGNGIYNWGYGEPGSGFQLPGPVLCVQQGEIVDVTLTNNLPVATSIQFPGQENVTADGSPDGPVADPGTGALLSLATEAGALTGVVHYSFTATHAGTYLYESGSDPQLQVQMGLFGAVVVRPRFEQSPGNWVPIDINGDDVQAIPLDGGTNNEAKGMIQAWADGFASHAACAYASLQNPAKCDPLAIYDGTSQLPDPQDPGHTSFIGENILMLSEIDPALHAFMEQQADPDGDVNKLNWNSYPVGYEAHYFLINGRSMPDTVAPNNAPWLPSQPYGSLAHVQPFDVHFNGLDTMLRYLAVGVTGYDFHPHSNHEHVIGEDGALMKALNGSSPGGISNNTEEKFNIMVAPGSTVDATFRWTNEDGYSDTSGTRVPVAWPNGLNMQEGDFWSGSPYLGNSGELNPGIVTKTQCGEYYHVAHSHDLTQATNYGATFGGMLTLIKVEPPKHLQNSQQGDFFIPACD